MKPRQSEIHFEALLAKQREVLAASARPAKTWGAYLAGEARMPEMLLKTSWETVKADLKKLVDRHRGA